MLDCLGDQVTYVASGCIRVPEGSLPERLHLIHNDLRTLIERHQPAVMAVEQVFVNRNVSSALKLGQARGAAICAAAGLDQPMQIAEYTPAEIKLSIVGNGRAAKPQVQHMVRALLDLEDAVGRELAEDAADALAIALCHARSVSQPNVLANWGSSRKGRTRARSAAAYKRR